MSDRLSQLIVSVNHRLLQTNGGEDPAPLHDPRGIAEARELARLAGDPRGGKAHLHAAVTLAWWHWFRYLVLPVGQDQDEAKTALRWAERVVAVDPTLVADEMVSRLRQTTQPTGRRFDRATELYERYESTADRSLIDAAIALFQQVVDETPSGDPGRPERLAALGNAHQARYERVGDEADLTAAITFGQAAVDGTDKTGPDRAMHLHNLSLSYHLRFKRHGRSSDLDTATDHARASLAAVPQGNPQRSMPLRNLALLRWDEHRRSGSRPALEESIRLGEEAVAGAAAGGAGGAPHLNALALAYKARFEASGSDDDLAAFLGHAQQAVDAAETGDQDRSAYLCNLSLAYRERGVRATPGSQRRCEDLDYAVGFGQLAVDATPGDHPGRAVRVNALALAHQARGEASRSLADLDAAIRLGLEAIGASSRDDANGFKWQSNLTHVYVARYELSKRSEDLDAAIEATRAALATLPDASSYRGQLQDTLGTLYDARAEVAWSAALADPGSLMTREAAGRLPPDHPFLRAMRLLIGAGRAADAGTERALRDLTAAITQAERTLTEDVADIPAVLLPALRSELGTCYRRRYHRTGRWLDLKAALLHCSTAVADAGQVEGLTDLGDLLCNLGVVRRTRFERTGKLADLTAAVDAVSDAVEVVAADHPNRAVYLSTLANVLHTRSKHFGPQTDTDADLDLAIRYGTQAAEGTPADHPDQARYLANLAGALSDRFERVRAGEDIDRAIGYGREAVEATPPNHANYAGRAANLALAYSLRHHHSGSAADLEQAVLHARQAVAAVPEGQSSRPAHQQTLANIYARRFEVTGDQQDLQHALDLWKASVDTTRNDDPQRASRLVNLARGYQIRSRAAGAGPGRAGTSVAASPSPRPVARLRRWWARPRTPADQRRALRLLQNAADETSAPTTDRTRAALALADAAAAYGDLPRALAGLATAVELLPMLAWHGLDGDRRERHLIEMSGVAATAAALAIANGQPRRAVEILEHGRSVLWGQVLQTRTDLTHLEDDHPDLAKRLRVTRRGLDAAPDLLAADDDAPVDRESVCRERGRLAHQWDQLVDEVRKTTRYRYFLKPKRFKDLARAIGDRPVLVVNVAQPRCDALIIRDGGVTLVPLPQLSEREVGRRVTGYLDRLADVDGQHARVVTAQARCDALERSGSGDAAERLAAYSAFNQAKVALSEARQAREDQLSEALAWLWDAVAEPVLNRLELEVPGAGGGHETRPPRVWWCPTGLLTLLPLHAAGHYGSDGSAAPGKTVGDLVVSSYTPTLWALAEAARRGRATAQRGPEAELPGTEAKRRGRAVVDRVDGSPDRPMLVVTVARPPGEVELASAESERDHLVSLLRPHPRLLDEQDDDRVPTFRATCQQVRDDLASHRWVHLGCHGTQDLGRPSRGRIRLYDGDLTVADLAGAQHAGGFAYLSACKTATGGRDLPDETITLAAALHHTGFQHVIAAQWSVADAVAAAVARNVYNGLVDDTGRLVEDRSAEALHEAVSALRPQLSLSDWTPFTHTGP